MSYNPSQKSLCMLLILPKKNPKKCAACMSNATAGHYSTLNNAPPPQLLFYGVQYSALPRQIWRVGLID